MFDHGAPIFIGRRDKVGETTYSHHVRGLLAVLYYRCWRHRTTLLFWRVRQMPKVLYLISCGADEPCCSHHICRHWVQWVHVSHLQPFLRHVSIEPFKGFPRSTRVLESARSNRCQECSKRSFCFAAGGTPQSASNVHLPCVLQQIHFRAN